MKGLFLRIVAVLSEISWLIISLGLSLALGAFALSCESLSLGAVGYIVSSVFFRLLDDHARIGELTGFNYSVTGLS